MSLPTFPEVSEEITIDDSISKILTSIAMEEVGLSHIINAEGEKIQFAIENCKSDLSLVLDVNESAALILEQVNDIQLVLINKLNKVLKCIPQNQKQYKAPQRVCCNRRCCPCIKYKC